MNCCYVSALFYIHKKKKQGRCKATCLGNRGKRKRGEAYLGGDGLGGGRGCGESVALHGSDSIRRSRVCPVHVDVSLRASVASVALIPQSLRKPLCSQNTSKNTDS